MDRGSRCSSAGRRAHRWWDGGHQSDVAWADIAAAYKAIPADQLDKAQLNLMGVKGVDDPKNASGRVVVGLRADPSFVEVTGKGIDIKGVDSLLKGGAGTAMIASFPAEVIGAVSVTGLGKQLADLYTSLTASGDPGGIKSGLDKMGISSAQQIETLLGAETGAVVGATKGRPEFAVRTRGNDADAALAIARRALGASPDGKGATATKVTGPDGIVVGMGPGLTAATSNGSGSRLGGSEAFKQVIPDAGKADFAAYVDLEKTLTLLREQFLIELDSPKDNPQHDISLKPLKALGVTATGGAEPSFRLRVSVK